MNFIFFNIHSNYFQDVYAIIQAASRLVRWDLMKSEPPLCPIERTGEILSIGIQSCNRKAREKYWYEFNGHRKEVLWRRGEILDGLRGWLPTDMNRLLAEHTKKQQKLTFYMSFQQSNRDNSIWRGCQRICSPSNKPLIWSIMNTISSCISPEWRNNRTLSTFWSLQRPGTIYLWTCPGFSG